MTQFNEQSRQTIVAFYLSFYKKNPLKTELPQFSLISSGSAAIAIGRILKKHRLPKIKILTDDKLAVSKDIIANIKSAHCELYFTDLSSKELSSKEILILTENVSGIDLTFSQEMIAYSDLCYEVLSMNPDFIFVPYGSGKLFFELLSTYKNHIMKIRFNSKRTALKESNICSILGATTNNSLSKADKLYCPFNPSKVVHKAFIKQLKYERICGSKTGIFSLKEEIIDKAYDFAKYNGITCEPSGISGLALYFKMEDQIPTDSRVVIVNTGKLKLV